MKSLKLKIMSTAVGFALSAFNVVANENSYQFSVAGAVMDETSDSGPDMRLYAAMASAYLRPVSTGNFPYAEADFVARTPFVQAVYGRANMELLSSDIGGNVYLLGIGMFDKQIPVFANINLGKTSLKGEINQENIETSIDSKLFEVGYYFNDLTGIMLGYSLSDFETAIGSDSITNSSKTIELQFKKLIRHENSSFTNIVVKALQDKEDEDNIESTEVGLLANYYFNKSFGIGAGYTLHNSDDEDNEGKTLDLIASYYFSPFAGIDSGFSKFSGDNSENDKQSLSFSFYYRF